MGLNNFEKNNDYPEFVEEKAQKLLNIINSAETISPQVEFIVEDVIALAEGENSRTFLRESYLKELKEQDYKDWSILDFKFLLEMLSFKSPFYKKLIEKIRFSNNQ